MGGINAVAGTLSTGAAWITAARRRAWSLHLWQLRTLESQVLAGLAIQRATVETLAGAWARVAERRIASLKGEA